MYIQFWIFTHIFILCITGSIPCLVVNINTCTVPDTTEVHAFAENKLLELLSSDDQLAIFQQTLSDELKSPIELKNGRSGSIRVDMILGDMSRLEYIKELSDKWVLSNIFDNILMTAEFIESCHAEDVNIEVVLEEASYQQVKSLCSKYIYI